MRSLPLVVVFTSRQFLVRILFNFFDQHCDRRAKLLFDPNRSTVNSSRRKNSSIAWSRSYLARNLQPCVILLVKRKIPTVNVIVLLRVPSVQFDLSIPLASLLSPITIVPTDKAIKKKQTIRKEIIFDHGNRRKLDRKLFSRVFALGNSFCT